MNAFQIGHGLDDGTVIGPLINAGGVEKSTSHVNDAVAKGATVLTGGGPLPEVGANFFAPTVLTGIDSTMLVHSEETFGPVAPLFVFESEEEVIAEVRRCCCSACSVELTQCSSFQISCRECAGFSSTCFFLQVIVFLAPLSIFNSFCLCVCAWVLFLLFYFVVAFGVLLILVLRSRDLLLMKRYHNCCLHAARTHFFPDMLFVLKCAAHSTGKRYDFWACGVLLHA